VVNTIAENCKLTLLTSHFPLIRCPGLANFVEPCFVAPNVPSERLDHGIELLEGAIPKQFKDDDLVGRNIENCNRRTTGMTKHTSGLIEELLTIANNEDTHWRYEIVAIRGLRTLIRRDQPPHGPQLEYFMDQALADHPSMRYVSYLTRFEEPCS
jgi:proteasome activator subunit 4